MPRRITSKANLQHDLVQFSQAYGALAMTLTNLESTLKYLGTDPESVLGQEFVPIFLHGDQAMELLNNAADAWVKVLDRPEEDFKDVGFWVDENNDVHCRDCSHEMPAELEGEEPEQALPIMEMPPEALKDINDPSLGDYDPGIPLDFENMIPPETFTVPGLKGGGPSDPDEAPPVGDSFSEEPFPESD